MSTFVSQVGEFATGLAGQPERNGRSARTIIMNDNKYARLQAQINLLSEQLQGMEELVICLLEQRAAALDPHRWHKPEMAQA